MGKITSIAFALVLLSGCVGQEPSPSGSGSTTGTAKGQELYDANCAACHGMDLKGSDSGPSFLSDIYAPGHHADQSFYSAVENGVAPHHWDFGPMPPVPALDTDDVTEIIAYVRARQQEAGF